jgi:hypothetical protein
MSYPSVDVFRTPTYGAALIGLIGIGIDICRPLFSQSSILLHSAQATPDETISEGRPNERDRATSFSRSTSVEWAGDPQFVAVGDEAAFNARRIRKRARL